MWGMCVCGRAFRAIFVCVSLRSLERDLVYTHIDADIVPWRGMLRRLVRNNATCTHNKQPEVNERGVF